MLHTLYILFVSRQMFHFQKMHRVIFFSFSLFLVICLIREGTAEQTEAQSSDWPGWRGAQRDGISTDTGLLDDWTEEGPPLRWKVTGLGKGISTVSLVQGVIYTIGEREGKSWLLALDDENGMELWSSPVGDGKPKSTPTVDGKQIFAIGHSGMLVCVEAPDGKERWRKDLVQEFDGKQANGIGYSESPLVDGDRVLCTPGGNDAIMVALDRHNGDVLWKAKLPLDPEVVGPQGADGAAFSSIVLSEACGIHQYIQLVGRGIISVRAEDGKLLWIYNRIANHLANVTTPVVHQDYVFCTTAYGTGSALLKLVPHEDGVRSEEVYFLNAKKMQNHHGGLVLVNDHIYCGHGQNNGFPLCVELKTGNVKWRPGRGPGTGSAAVVYADDHLYFRYEDGTMALIQATPDEYRLKGTFKIDSALGENWSHPVVAGGRLYLRDEDALICYDLRRTK